ncbi:MAG: hypothetical protein LBB07_01135 [Bifidobacteriaceae bacterium]|jgi:hypothetical protein|nr:hypothetical protein [Bifidobacteriaceae bacterium]
MSNNFNKSDEKTNVTKKDKSRYSIANNKRKKKVSANRKLKEKFRNKSLGQVLNAISGKYGGKYSFHLPSDIEFERQKELNSNMPYKGTPALILAKKASIISMECIQGMRNPIIIKDDCEEQFYLKLYKTYESRKEKWEFKPIPLKYRASINTMRISNFNKIKCYGLGTVKHFGKTRAVVVEMRLFRLCWRVHDVKVL